MKNAKQTTMKALVKAKPGIGLQMEQVPVPEYGANDVLVRIKKTAICGTDIHIWNWDEFISKLVPVPMVVGHEFCGEIVEVGAAVTKYSVGQRISGEGHVIGVAGVGQSVFPGHRGQPCVAFHEYEVGEVGAGGSPLWKGAAPADQLEDVPEGVRIKTEMTPKGVFHLADAGGGEEVLHVHGEHPCLAGMVPGVAQDGASGVEPVCGGVGGNCIEDVVQEAALCMLEEGFGSLDPAWAPSSALQGEAMVGLLG